MYRTIDGSFWTDPKIRDLGPSEKLLALYLVTNPHSHVGGIYYLPDSFVIEETRLTTKGLAPLWDTLSRVGFCRRDKNLQVVWVCRMFSYQGRGPKNERSVAKHLGTLHNSCLVKEFLIAYPQVKSLIPDTLLDTLSIGVPAQDHVKRKKESNIKKERNQEQEQEQEQETPCSPPGDKSVEQQDLVIEHYKTYHPQSKPGDKERQKIHARLKEGYTVEQLHEAIDGCHRSPHHCGQNERRTKYQSLELIMRDSSHVQQFLEIPHDQTPTSNLGGRIR